jgi:hypothetical protein
MSWLAKLRRSSAGCRLWLPGIALAVLLAGIGQASHRHKADDAGTRLNDHCSFCLQLSRVAGTPAPVAAPVRTAAIRTSIEQPMAAVYVHSHLASYEARGPPTA